MLYVFVEFIPGPIVLTQYNPVTSDEVQDSPGVCVAVGVPGWGLGRGGGGGGGVGFSKYPISKWSLLYMNLKITNVRWQPDLPEDNELILTPWFTLRWTRQVCCDLLTPPPPPPIPHPHPHPHPSPTPTPTHPPPPPPPPPIPHPHPTPTPHPRR